MQEDDAPSKRFSGRSVAYSKGRPDYPETVFNHLSSNSVLRKGAKVADISSGTDIFTGQLLDHGVEVYAVEPNQDMRGRPNQGWDPCGDFTACLVGRKGPCYQMEAWIASSNQSFH